MVSDDLRRSQRAYIVCTVGVPNQDGLIRQTESVPDGRVYTAFGLQPGDNKFSDISCRQLFLKTGFKKRTERMLPNNNIVLRRSN